MAKSWDLRLGDLGVCKVKDNTQDLASTMIGTPLYFSPEICQNSKYDEKSDIWGLGCICFEMAVGHSPFAGKSPAAIMLKIVMDSVKAEDFQKLVSNKHVVNCVLQCLSKRAIRRPGAGTVGGTILCFLCFEDTPLGGSRSLGWKKYINLNL